MENVREENAEKAEDRVWKASAYAFGEEMHNSLGQTGTIKRIQGIAQGIAQGNMQMLVALVKDGILKVEEAAKRLDISESEFEQRMNRGDYYL